MNDINPSPEDQRSFILSDQLWVMVMGGLVPFAASFLAEPMAQSSHPPLVAKTWAKIYSGTKNASGS